MELTLEFISSLEKVLMEGLSFNFPNFVFFDLIIFSLESKNDLKYEANVADYTFTISN